MTRYLPILVVAALFVFIVALFYPLWGGYLGLINQNYLFCAFVAFCGLQSLKIAKRGRKHVDKGCTRVHVRRGVLERLVFALSGFALLGLGSFYGVYLILA